MTFVAGTLLGVVVGFGIAALLIRRTSGASLVHGDRLGIAVAIAAVALVAASVALARMDHDDHNVAAPASPTSTTSSTRAPATSTTTEPRATVTVPNVVGETRNAALAALRNLGLHPHIETIAMTTVPPGFVLSQNPVTASLVAPGSTVSLVVSAAT